ncbi:MAG: winged helix-turn-helix transcriptional regulator [Lachnospiraceae bacterium]|nr:winged helix-turn-helix transcriptional regulator [Lachnospiraceae bacterium]
MKQPTVFVLYNFNQAHKKMNVIYHDYAKSIGLSDAAFWLLYSVYEHGKPCTQKDLCHSWFYAPQTINSAIKAMEEQGYITLERVPANKKNKQILFTEKGKTLVDEKIAPLVQAEERSFERLDEQERELLLEITQKHIGILEEEINRIEQMSSED